MDPLHVERVGPSEQAGRWDEEGWGMSYANYSQDQAAACARRARLASSPESTLELRWLKLAEQAQDTGSALGHESDPTATLFPLLEKPATYPVEYGKRAGELIARGARSLSPRKRK